MSLPCAYRSGDKVTTRRPKSLANWDMFFSSDDNFKVTQAVKNFLRYMVVDPQELNLVKTDVGFLMNDMFKDRVRDKTVQEVTTFYVWVCIPFRSASPTLRASQSSIFPFDLYHAAFNVTHVEIAEFKSILKSAIHVDIHTRKHNEMPELPFPLRGGKSPTVAPALAVTT